MRSIVSECNHTETWRLADGRAKCRRCGARLTAARTAWARHRLPVAAKHGLVESFVNGESAARAARGNCCNSTAESFYHTIRQAMSEATGCTQPLTHIIEYSPSAASAARDGAALPIVRCVAVGFCRRDSEIGIFPFQGKLPQRHIPPCTLQGAPHGEYFALLPLAGEIVSLRSCAPPTTEIALSHLERRAHQNGVPAFWQYAREQLARPSNLRREYLHLHLAEAWFRFYHTEHDLTALIYELLQRQECASKSLVRSD